MAAIVQAQSGNWNATSTWTGGVIPGNGDTVTLTSTVTVTTNTIVGASNGNYSASTKNPGAIQMNSLGSIVIAPGISFTCRGDISVNTTSYAIGYGLNLGAGSVFTFDSSLTSPTTTSYAMFPINNYCYYCSINAVGTQANPAILQSSAGSAPGAMLYNASGTSYLYFGSLNLQWAKVIRWGSATTDALDVAWQTTNVSVNVSNTVFDSCGLVHAVLNAPTNVTNNWTNVVWQNSLSNNNIDLTQHAVYQGCVFDKIFSGGLPIQSSFSTCLFYGGHAFPGGNSGSAWLSYNNNFTKNTGNQGSNINGSYTNSLWITDDNVSNPHYIILNPNFNLAITNVIFEFSNTDGEGDTTSLTGNPANTNPYYFRGILVLPNGASNDSGTMTSFTGGFSPNGRADLQHCTYHTGDQGGTYSETGSNAAGTIVNWKNNIAWDYPGMNRGSVLRDAGHESNSAGIVTDVVAPMSADYNCSFNIPNIVPSAPSWYVNSGRGYSAAYSATPGMHDYYNIDPKFVDNTRNVPTFDSGYLKTVAPKTWEAQATSYTFAVGDLVSHVNATYYGGILINYICKVAHAKSTSGTEPGVFTTAWRTYWEFATYTRLKTALANQLTITDPALGLVNADYITALRTWIYAGFAPQNASLRMAGWDGSDIGAVPVRCSNQQLSNMGCG